MFSGRGGFFLQEIKQSRCGVSLQLLIPRPVSLGDKLSFKLRELLARELGNGLVDFDDVAHDYGA
jgi:hypothetical protein